MTQEDLQRIAGYLFFGGILFFVVMILRGFRCPKCKSWFKLRATGETKNSGRHTLAQYICRKCDFEIWRSQGDTFDTGPPGGG